MHNQQGYSEKFGEVRVPARRACIQTALRRLCIKAAAPFWHVHGLWSGHARGIGLGCTVVVQSNGAAHTTHDPRQTATRVSCPSFRTCGLTSCNTYENSIPYADCVNCIPIVSQDTDGAERTSELLLRAMQALYREKFGWVKHNLQAALILPPRIPHGVGSPLGHPGGETKGRVGKIPKMKFVEVRVPLETFTFFWMRSSGEVRVSQ